MHESVFHRCQFKEILLLCVTPQFYQSPTHRSPDGRRIHPAPVPKGLKYAELATYEAESHVDRSSIRQAVNQSVDATHARQTTGRFCSEVSRPTADARLARVRAGSRSRSREVRSDARQRELRAAPRERVNSCAFSCSLQRANKRWIHGYS